jgi:hypothetical protein
MTMDYNPKATPMSDCPHCSHPWDGHGRADVDYYYARPCECGCMWPQTVPPPPPLTPRQQLVAVLRDTLWTAFEEQEHIYVDRSMDMIDASGNVVVMDAVAEAVLTKLEALGQLKPQPITRV